MRGEGDCKCFQLGMWFDDGKIAASLFNSAFFRRCHVGIMVSAVFRGDQRKVSIDFPRTADQQKLYLISNPGSRNIKASSTKQGQKADSVGLLS